MFRRIRNWFFWHQTFAPWPLYLPLFAVQWFSPSAHWCYEWDGLFISKGDPEWGDHPTTCMCGFNYVTPTASTTPNVSDLDDE